MLDTIVIGGGPIGSRVAFKLAEMGHTVHVVEKNESIGQKPCCTGIISQECVTAFSIPPEVIRKQTDCARIFSPSGEYLRICRPETQVCIVDRPAFDRALADKARSAGAEYHLATRAQNVTFDRHQVIVEVENKNSLPRLEAKAVVIAAGFGSPLVTKIGMGRPGYFALGAQTEVETKGIEEIEVYLGQKLAPGFFGWLVPFSPGKGLAGLLTHHNPGLKLEDLISRLSAQGKIISGEHLIKTGGIPLKPLARTFDNRLLIVGDAAGQVKPTTGGGLYFGLICADIVADTLHNALQTDDLSARNLSPYEKNWQKKLGRELRVEYYVRRFYEHLSDKQIDRIFTRIKSAGIADSVLKSTEVSFDWHGGLLFKALKLGAASEIKRHLRLPIRGTGIKKQ